VCGIFHVILTGVIAMKQADLWKYAGQIQGILEKSKLAQRA
jgi:hypothetical protein